MRKVWEWDIMSAEMKRRYSPRPAPHGGVPVSTYCTIVN